MLDLDAIRDRIRARYAAKELSATGVWHKEHGLGQTTVRNFLDGLTQSLTLDTIAKLEEPLGVDAHWIIFGEEKPEAVSDAQLDQLTAIALDEIQPGAPLSEIRTAVAGALRAQLARVLSGQLAPPRSVEETAPDTGAQSPAPTKRSSPAKSRTT